MNFAFRNLPSVVLAVSALTFSSCTVPSSTGPEAITKVNPYHLKSAALERTDDPMIRFEQKRLLHGAVDAAEMKTRFGNYYTVFWETDQVGVPTTIRLNYRQAKTGPMVLTKEIEVQSPKKKNTTKFEIVGDDYQENGQVTMWKASIVRNGEVITEYLSYAWK